MVLIRVERSGLSRHRTQPIVGIAILHAVSVRMVFHQFCVPDFAVRSYLPKHRPSFLPLRHARANAVLLQGFHQSLPVFDCERQRSQILNQRIFLKITEVECGDIERPNHLRAFLHFLFRNDRSLHHLWHRLVIHDDAVHGRKQPQHILVVFLHGRFIARAIFKHQHSVYRPPTFTSSEVGSEIFALAHYETAPVSILAEWRKRVIVTAAHLPQVHPVVAHHVHDPRRTLNSILRNFFH